MKASYIDHMGTDLSVVNAARVSFGKTSEWGPEGGLSKADQGLIQFLARGCTSGDWEQLLCDMGGSAEQEFEDYANHIRKMPPHWTPFAHTAISIHLKMPIFVARQIMKHTTGFVYNEISRRYVDDTPEFYIPDVWRKRADNVKQGSSETATGGDVPLYMQEHTYEVCISAYSTMLEVGVAPEQARMVLPQSMYTEVITTSNLYGWANLFVQRTDPHAQKETQDLALQIGEIIQPLYPVSWKALTE